MKRAAAKVGLVVIAALMAACLMAASGSSTNEINVYGRVDFKTVPNDSPVVSGTYICSGPGVCAAQGQNISNSVCIFNPSAISRTVVIHADNGDDIQVRFLDGTLALEDGEHAIFTYVPRGKDGQFLLLKAHKI